MNIRLSFEALAGQLSLTSLYMRRSNHGGYRDYSIDWGDDIPGIDDYRHPPRRSKRILVFIVFFLLALALWTWLLPYLQEQSYTRFANRIEVAQVIAIPTHKPGVMNIKFSFIDSNGHPMPTTEYLLSCDEWGLEGNTIVSSPLGNHLGLYSGYKLTRIEGHSCYQDGRIANDISINLNEDDNGFFQMLHEHGLGSPLVQETISSSDFFTPDGKRTVYDVFVSSTGLTVVPSK